MNAIQPDWPAPARVRAVATTRAGGASAGPYSSLNLADHVGDDPARVAENRRRLEARLALPGAPGWLHQVHGARVLTLPGNTSEPADAAVTRCAGQVCAVLTADCLPVLLARTDGAAVGVAHAGWRGLAAGVLGAAVAALGGPPGGVIAWLGPAISASAYEVGAEVRAALAAHNPELVRAFEPNANGRWQADLALAGRIALEAAGVAGIHGGGYCTYGDGRFYSHRREAPCGRTASLIWLQK